MNNSYDVDDVKEELRPSWWARRSNMEKKLLITAIIAIFLIIILVIILAIFLTKSPTTCISPSCVHITNELIEHMDTSIDPCDNFYQFTCGNFLSNIQLGEEDYKSVGTRAAEKVQHRIQGIIEEPEREYDKRSLILAKKLYKACLNVTATDERGLKLVKDSLRQIGGWPVLEGSNWVEKDFDWKSVTYKLRELGYNFEFFIILDIIPDKTNPSSRIISLRKPYDPVQHLTEEEEDTFFNFLMDISIEFGADPAKAKNDLRDVIDFVKKLHDSDEEKEEDKNNKFDSLTLSELQYKFRDISWLDYINRLQFPAPNISYDQIVSVTDTLYFMRLQNLLKRTPKRILANYIAWKVVIEQSFQFPSDVRDIAEKYFKLFTKRSIPPRSEWCSQYVNHMFSLPLQVAYVKKYLSGDIKSSALDMFNNIKKEYTRVLTNLDWIDEETRIRALERLSTSNAYIAYPNELLDSDRIEARYYGFQVEEDNFLASVLNANYYQTNLRFKKLHESVEVDEEFDEGYATYSRSYYTAKTNTITIPGGILQGLMYDVNRPQYLNYGALGANMGHQIFHTAFENKGCSDDSDYYNWIATPALQNFNKKLTCVAMHYGKYYIPDIKEHLNSSNTKYEDIADIAGLKLAYQVYDKLEKSNGPEVKLPGFDYTPKQLFWISTAIRFCSKGTPEDYENIIAHSTKSPNMFRALGILRNSKEFANDFNCPADKYMNNEDKCELW